MQLAGHRGVASLAPENTLAGIQKAVFLDLPWVEIDVQLSADNIPVIIHDKTVDRCSNGKGSVADLSYLELQKFDAGSWFAPSFCSEKIPSLNQVLILCHSHTIQINIELKVYPGDDISNLCEQVSQIIKNSTFPYSRLLFSSFNLQALMEIKKRLPQVRRGKLCKTLGHNWQEKLRSIDAYSAHCHYRKINKHLAKQVKQAGYQLICYTANDPEEVREHWHWGVDLIITDKPQLYLTFA